jgi:hypothetical protein
VQTRSSDISIDLLSALITRNGGELITDPPTIANVPNFFVAQTAGDTVLRESGFDEFDIVLDKAPLANVVIGIGLDLVGFATLDRSSLTFTPENWNVRQRVRLTGLDNSTANPDRTIQLIVGVVDANSASAYHAVSPQWITATVRDDDAPLLRGDYNGDGHVNAADYTTWRNQLGGATEPYRYADGDGDEEVAAGDYGVWRSNYGSSLPAGSGGLSQSANVALADVPFVEFSSAPRFDSDSPFALDRISDDASHLTTRDTALLAWFAARSSGELDAPSFAASLAYEAPLGDDAVSDDAFAALEEEWALSFGGAP